MNPGQRANEGDRIFLVELKATAGDVPGEVRLRRALKCLLRSFGLRAVRIEEIGPRAVRGLPDAAANEIDVLRGLPQT